MALVRINIPSKAELPDLWDEIEDHFPHPSTRPGQREALSVIRWGLTNDEFDNIVIQAPTGIGKSAIGMTIQSMFKDGYVLTPTLGLTEQYRRDFGHIMAEVKGRSNFPCWIESGTADGAPCYRKKGNCAHTKEEDPCPYYAQRFAAEKHRLVLSNPSYMFRVQQGSEAFATRDVAIIDEGHNVESFFLNLMDIVITNADWVLVNGGGSTLPFHYHPHDWVDDIDALHEGAKRGLAIAVDDDDDRKIKKFRTLASKTATLVQLLKDPDNCVVEANTTQSQFKPIRVSQFVPDYLDVLATKRVFMSATILDIDTFLKNLGLDEQKTLYVNITKSPFPPANFNVHYSPCGPMSYGRRKHTIPKQVKAIGGIMNHYPDKRGVVLPHSHAIRKEIVQGLKDAGFGDRILTHADDSRSRAIALEKFQTELHIPWVLVSTYVTEGFDFKGELAEFLVVCKIPYLYTPDPQIRQRMEQDEHSWRDKHEGTPKCPYEMPSKYTNGMCGSFMCTQPCQSWAKLQTTTRLVQMMGRIVRTPTDVGHMFILDRAWDRFFKNHGPLLPLWFKNGLKGPPNWLKKYLP